MGRNWDSRPSQERGLQLNVDMRAHFIVGYISIDWPFKMMTQVFK